MAISGFRCMVFYYITPGQKDIAMLLHDELNGHHLRTILVCLLPLLLVPACIVIPVPTGEQPYYAGVIPNLQVGVTKKNEVLEELGVPDAAYHGGSELIYIETQESWKIAYLAYNAAGVETLHKRFVLSVSFDAKGVLSAFELDTAGDDFGDCTSHGICFGKTNAVMRYADPETDAASKGFKPSTDQCSIYLHGPGNKKAYEVSLNGRIPVNIFSTGAYVHWNTEPGRQSLVIFPEPANLDFDCSAGEIAFVHFGIIRPGPSRLRMEDSKTGQAHTATRHMVWLPSG